MRHRPSVLVVVCGALILWASVCRAQDLTVGLLIHEPAAFEGYTLFGPNRSRNTYLIDNQGRLVHTWAATAFPGQAMYLLETGHLLRSAQEPSAIFNAGGAGGRVQELAWDGALVWDYLYASDQHLQHHDIESLPGGNVLLIAWEYKTGTEAIDAGRDPSQLRDGELWPDTIIEVEPDGASGGTIVWEWHAWDHLTQDHDPSKSNYGVVEDHPELIDLNFPSGPGPGAGADWLHVNSVKYNQDFDQIILSVHNFHEVWVIDHSTTTAEAAGHTGGLSGRGGDLLYRWGNPQAYRAGGASDQQLFGQHDAQWIPAGYPGEGNILLFNNGLRRPAGDYSSVDEIEPPVDAAGHYSHVPGTAYEPDAPTWSYTSTPPTDLFSQNISGAQRLPNGNTLICEGAFGSFWEVTAAGEVVWLYVNPVANTGVVAQGEPVPGGPSGWQNGVFKIRRYAPDFPGLADKELTPGGPIEPYGLLRNDEVIILGPVEPPLSTLFTGSGWNSLDSVDDMHVPRFTSGGADPAPSARPLVFYQVHFSPFYGVWAVKDAGSGVRIHF